MRQIHCDVSTKLSTLDAGHGSKLKSPALPRLSLTSAGNPRSTKSPAGWNSTRWTDGSICYYCCNPLTPSYIKRGSIRPPTASTRDHLVPKCRGGSYIPDNIVQACAGCNEEKGQLTSEEYLIVLYFRTMPILGRVLSYYCNLSRRARYWCSQRSIQRSIQRARRKAPQSENSAPQVD